MTVNWFVRCLVCVHVTKTQEHTINVIFILARNWKVLVDYYFIHKQRIFLFLVLIPSKSWRKFPDSLSSLFCYIKPRQISVSVKWFSTKFRLIHVPVALLPVFLVAQNPELSLYGIVSAE